jgi:hypothetical protein
MIQIKRILTIAATTCFVCLLFNNSVSAHDFLKDPLKERYGLKSVSCSACHPGSNKAINNAFGMKFKAAFKGKDFTKRIHAAKDMKDKAAGKKLKEEIGAEMVVAFNAVVGEIEKEKMSFAEMAKAGILNGTKLEKSVIAEMGKAQGVEDK